MDNIAYEEFPKLTNEHDTSSDNRDRENDGETEDDRSTQGLHHHHHHHHHHRPPPPPSGPYTIAMEPVYPDEPPPAYTVASAYELPGVQPYAYAGAGAAGALSHPDAIHFGVLIDRPDLPPPIVVSQPPTDFLPLSIFNLIFCCLLFGVFAVVKSVATRAAVDVGDYNVAYAHSLEARNWNIAASVTGGIIWTLFIVSIVVFSVIGS